jgi:translation initiation factor IF-2
MTSAWRGQHLLPGPPEGRPRVLRVPLQRRSAGHRPGAGGRRQLPHLPRPPAVGGDPGGAVQAGAGRPGRRRPVQPPHLPGRPWNRLDHHRRHGAAGRERPAARAGAAGAQRGMPPGAGGRRPGPRPGGAAPAPEHGVALEPGHLRPGRRRTPPDRGAGPPRRADGGRHVGQRRLPARPHLGPWPPTPMPGCARSRSGKPTTISTAPPSSASAPSWPGHSARAAGCGRSWRPS